MNEFERINQPQDITSESIEDNIFELEKQIDMRKAFILINKEDSLKSESLRSRIDFFEKELKNLNIQLIKTHLQLRELEDKKRKTYIT